MNFLDDAGSTAATPGSPPDLTGSKSSKSSSFHSYHSDNNSILEDVGNFEDIGLDDDSRADADISDFAVKMTSSPYDVTYATDLRATATARRRAPMASTTGNQRQRELTAGKPKQAYPSLGGQVKGATDGLGLMPTTGSRRVLTSPSTGSLPIMKRHRSSSPNMPITARQAINAAGNLKARRSSWQANRERKTAVELEMECDEDDGDDVPDDCFLENVPISPRPPQERIPSRPVSAATSPERRPKEKEKVRSVGNGTSPRPAEQGELRSPRSPRSAGTDSELTRGTSMGQFPMSHDTFPKGRAKSWTAALSELSEEAKALTEALEAHAEDEEAKSSDPAYQKRMNSSVRAMEKPRVKSAFAELPPLRRTDIMIDPLPISKEKEAVLSRTRPSWLPPKDPAEEKRHLKEYQRMMAKAIKVDDRKEAEQQARSTCKDDTASSLLRIWEEHVLPNWDDTTRQKRTRELWWRGVAPRSRGAVWAKAIGNELGLSDSSYSAASRRAQALEKTIKSGSQLNTEELKKKTWLVKIEADVKETFLDLRIFQPDGPLHKALLDVLKAYAMYRSDVGYVHGTNTIAAILLLNLPTPSASFQALSNILNRPLPLSIHTNDAGGTSRIYTLLLTTLSHKSPRLYNLLTDPKFNLQPASYLQDLFQSMFTSVLSLDNATRLWDVLVFEGDAVLVRAGVAYLVQLEGRLLGAQNAGEICRVVRGGLDGGLGEEEWMRCLRSAGKS
ncbi:hypothetical protein BJ875DRAFT_115151 [Amylocarpus encephaloides]|uniref:Rab-GAP TBC domain-containing protein n=1 Tax=Amylocarpus encephaloides TaxID=45428 RepID=A0A9P7YEH9_9HELO|nr:hypothetical protein BJ875DRAFT_115151 [Amylocarpus encephaloides]